MVKTGAKPQVQNGVARQLTEYECPNCGNKKILDRPYDW